MINDLWYKNAVIYCVSVATYLDTNGDGIGDFQGIMRRLDYLQGLGVTAIWLMPFQPSPGRDDGYASTKNNCSWKTASAVIADICAWPGLDMGVKRLVVIGSNGIVSCE